MLRIHDFGSPVLNVIAISALPSPCKGSGDIKEKEVGTGGGRRQEPYMS